MFHNVDSKGLLLNVVHKFSFGNRANSLDMRQYLQNLLLLRTSMVGSQFLSDVNYCFNSSLVELMMSLSYTLVRKCFWFSVRLPLDTCSVPKRFVLCSWGKSSDSVFG